MEFVRDEISLNQNQPYNEVSIDGSISQIKPSSGVGKKRGRPRKENNGVASVVNGSGSQILSLSSSSGLLLNQKQPFNQVNIDGSVSQIKPSSGFGKKRGRPKKENCGFASVVNGCRSQILSSSSSSVLSRKPGRPIQYSVQENSIYNSTSRIMPATAQVQHSGKIDPAYVTPDFTSDFGRTISEGQTPLILADITNVHGIKEPVKRGRPLKNKEVMTVSENLSSKGKSCLTDLQIRSNLGETKNLGKRICKCNLTPEFGGTVFEGHTRLILGDITNGYAMNGAANLGEPTNLEKRICKCNLTPECGVTNGNGMNEPVKRGRPLKDKEILAVTDNLSSKLKSCLTDLQIQSNLGKTKNVHGKRKVYIRPRDLEKVFAQHSKEIGSSKTALQEAIQDHGRQDLDTDFSPDDALTNHSDVVQDFENFDDNDVYNSNGNDENFEDDLSSSDIYLDLEDNDDGIRQNTNGSVHFFGPHSINLKDLPPCPEYISLGPPSKQCKFCGAIMWNEERVNKRVKNGDPLFSICCCKGQVSLPKVEAVPQYLSELYSDPVRGPPFLQNIRVYNSMVCMTSNGGKIDHSINKSRGPYVYKILGLHYHQYGSLMPDDDKTPKFCQLYIYDTQNEVNNRMRAVNKDDGNAVDADVLKGLLDMLDQINPLVKKFRMARDRFEKDKIVDLKIVMKVSRKESGRENNMTDGDEVAALIVGEPG